MRIPRLLALATALRVACLAQSAPQQVWFTWQGDTGTTLTVNFQTTGRTDPKPRVYWDTEPRAAVVGAYRFKAAVRTLQIEGLPDRFLHRAELTGLQPGGTVWLVAGNPETGLSRERMVRTIASGPLRFCSGGDMGPSADTRRLLRRAAAESPDFALIGGDIAYENGDPKAAWMFDTWLTYWGEEMVTPAGFSVPVALAIGNHEVRGGYRQPQAHAPFYFGLFAQAERSFFARRFGSDLAVLFLDSGHCAEHGGEQAAWLEQELQRAQDVRFKIAIYHVSLYPSYRQYEETLSVAGRQHWAPLFERHRLDVAFEHHDHTLKRTAPLRDGKVATDGVVYLGDGCFGQRPRGVTYGGRWYLSRQGSVQHFWCVDVDRDGLRCRAIDKDGRTVAVHPDSPAGALADAALATTETRYLLPPDAVSVSTLSVADGWQGGEVTVTVTNQQATAMLVSVALQRAPAGVALEVGPVAPIAAGAKATIALRFSAREDVPAGEVQLRLLITGTFAGPDGRPVVLSDIFAVPVAK